MEICALSINGRLHDMQDPKSYEGTMSFIKNLNKFADYIAVSKPSINHATVDVTERYARKTLKVKKDEPLVFRGLTLTCRGSKRWRAENDRAFGQPHRGH
jgi:hypothetical protein